MRYAYLAVAGWLLLSGIFLTSTGAAASDNKGLELDVENALLGIEQVNLEEQAPNYWKNWTKESTFARNRAVQSLSRKGLAAERLEKIEPRMVRLKEKEAKELTLSDVGVITLKVVGVIIAIPIVLTGYVGILVVEGLIESGASFGFDRRH